MTRLTGITVNEDSIEGVRLVLASRSPRRAELLRAAGIEFDVLPADTDEAMSAEESPEAYVERVARLKAEAVWQQAPGRIVLGADTVVVVDGEVLGKPADAEAAKHMLRRLSGRAHVVLTGIALVFSDAGSTRTQTRVARTVVELAPLSDTVLDWYVASGEPLDKAGAYAIQGLASRFVKRIDGSYSNVVGLPVAELYALCTEAGILVS
jgi:septum formation protein